MKEVVQSRHSLLVKTLQAQLMLNAKSCYQYHVHIFSFTCTYAHACILHVRAIMYVRYLLVHVYMIYMYSSYVATYVLWVCMWVFQIFRHVLTFVTLIMSCSREVALVISSKRWMKVTLWHFHLCSGELW